MKTQALNDLLNLMDGALDATGTTVEVKDKAKLQQNIGKLVQISASGKGVEAAAARYLVRGAALAAGVIPSSIHELYIARGKGDVPNTFTVPAMNLRVLAFEAAKAVFRVAKKINAGAILFEIARSEIGYTDQRPTEYATNILGAAIAEDFSGPVFIQGDHFQISAGRYFDDAQKEINAVKDITREAIHAGFYNIDVDTSTLVDLEKETVPEQQTLNSNLSAEMTAYIRSIEPEGITTSVGGEIGEVGGHNSTEEELRAYTDGYNVKLTEHGENLIGLSKISIQTGTSHGGVVLPDGSIAQVSVDFDTLKKLSQISREEFHMGGAVQHGASTLPQDAFSKFVEAEAVEVHLATNFQNMFFDYCPKDLIEKMYKDLDENNQHERKADMTDDQFYYKTRKRALGKFKNEILALPSEAKAEIAKAWEAQFAQLFDSLSVAGTQSFVNKTITPVKVLPSLDSYIEIVSGDFEEEDTSDLAD
jgi:fructose/tagatose bisphosphate aldolase